MKSQRGFLAAVVLLLALPITLLLTLALGGGDGVMIHIGLGAGAVLLALAVFDFKNPRALNWFGFFAAGILAGVFLIQAVSDAMPNNEELHRVAFGILGQEPEAVLTSATFLWLFATALNDGEGKNQVFGLGVLSVLICLNAYNYVGESPDVLKLLYVLPVIWLLVESIRPMSNEPPQSRLRARLAPSA